MQRSRSPIHHQVEDADHREVHRALFKGGAAFFFIDLLSRESKDGLQDLLSQPAVAVLKLAPPSGRGCMS